MDLMFFFNSVLLGIGLAMDAFSVSMANGLKEPSMKKGRMSLIAGIFALFQYGMPLIGWICIHTIVNIFSGFLKFIPYIALLLLSYIGGKMLVEGIKGSTEEAATSFSKLLVQGVATSIDALSVGFTIATYGFFEANISCIIIGLTTFMICLCGLQIGKVFGDHLAGKAGILGGCILIFIGLEIFVKGVFF